MLLTFDHHQYCVYEQRYVEFFVAARCFIVDNIVDVIAPLPPINQVWWPYASCQRFGNLCNEQQTLVMKNCSKHKCRKLTKIIDGFLIRIIWAYCNIIQRAEYSSNCSKVTSSMLVELTPSYTPYQSECFE